MPTIKCRIAALFLIFSLMFVGLGTGLCIDKVNINTATEQQLAALPGIGPAIAKRIVAYRKDHPFKQIEDIMQVKGIGPKVFEKIKELIKV